MQGQTAFGFKDLMIYLVGEMAKASRERHGETGMQHRRVEVTSNCVMSFLPRDGIEAILAGHCMAFHEMILDGIKEVWAAAPGTARRSARATVLAMDKAFGRNLRDFQQFKRRPSQGRRDSPDADLTGLPDEAEIADRVRRHQRTSAPPGAETPPPVQPATQPVTPPSAQPVARPEPAAEPQSAGQPILTTHRPSPEEIAACKANPAAMEALEACDPVGFARALGLDHPPPAYVEAARRQMIATRRQPAAPLAAAPLAARRNGTGSG